MNPIPYGYTFAYRGSDEEDERIIPVIPFLTGLAIAPFLYNAFQPGGYYPYAPPPYYGPYHYYGYPPNYYGHY